MRVKKGEIYLATEYCVRELYIEQLLQLFVTNF